MVTQIKTHPIVESAINLFDDWLRHRRAMRELREIDNDELARIAQELCVSPADLDTLVRRGPHASDELPRLLKSLGIDAVVLSRTQSLLQRDMVRVCASCQQKARCDHDLDAGTSAQHYAEYCANAPTIDSLSKKP
jgi:uncharacterized protein YjiS (DUF1127 family)